MDKKFAFQYGMMIACAALQQPIKSAAVIERRVIDHPEMDRWLLRIGETAYREAGLMGCLGYQLCKRGSSAPVLGTHFRTMAAIVGRAVGRAAMEEKRAAAERAIELSPEEVKTASALWLRNLISGGAGAAPEMGKLLLGGAIATGAAGGGLTWAANRNIKNDAEDIEAMKAKIRTYKRITQDIDDELNLRSSLAAG